MIPDQAITPEFRPAQNGPKIWIDLENTPHIPFFRPIIRELEQRGYRVVLTARDAFQTCDMASRFGLKYIKIGRHYGQNRLLKVVGLVVRAVQLVPFILREHPSLGLNHGSRAQILICNVMRVPTVMIMDYEHSRTPPFVRPMWEIVPEVLSDEVLHCTNKNRVRKFVGIKEDVYVPEFQPNASIIDQLDLRDQIVVTVRPPATEAHYHNPETELLFTKFMERACATKDVKVILLPRNKAQHDALTKAFPDFIASGKVTIPKFVVDGLNLLWHSDLAVSGGGTMNREAAALGIPVFSIFRGKTGAVDRSLVAQGRLVMIGSVDDVVNKIPLLPRPREGLQVSRSNRALNEIISHLTAILPIQATSGQRGRSSRRHL